MANKFAMLFMPMLCVMTACTQWSQEDAKHLFVVHKNMSVANKQDIEGFLNPRSAVALQGIQEVKPGVMEYAFEEKRAKLFRPSEAKCRFIVVVEKDTGVMTGWRYNGNPEYCTDNP